MRFNAKSKSEISHGDEVIHRLPQESFPSAPLQPMNNFG